MFSPEQLKVLSLLKQGLSRTEIGERMGKSGTQIDRFVFRMYRRLGLRGRGARSVLINSDFINNERV